MLDQKVLIKISVIVVVVTLATGVEVEIFVRGSILSNIKMAGDTIVSGNSHTKLISIRLLMFDVTGDAGGRFDFFQQLCIPWVSKFLGWV